MSEVEFYKDSEEYSVYRVITQESKNRKGLFLFSFDKKTIYNFWEDYPDKLTIKEIEIFKKDYPDLSDLIITDN